MFRAASILAVTACIASAEEPTLEERFLSKLYSNSQYAALQWEEIRGPDRPFAIGILTNSGRYVSGVRLQALRALMKGDWPAESAVPILAPMMRTSTSTEIRAEIAACLVAFGKASVPALIEELKTAGTDYWALGPVVISLKHLGKDARPALPILKALREGMMKDSNRASANPEPRPTLNQILSRTGLSGKAVLPRLFYRVDKAIQAIEPEYAWRRSLEQQVKNTREEIKELDREMPTEFLPESMRYLRERNAVDDDPLLNLSQAPESVIAYSTAFLGSVLVGLDPEELKSFNDHPFMDSYSGSSKRFSFAEYSDEDRLLAAKSLHRLGADAFPILPCLQLAVRDKAPTIRRLAVETLAVMATTNQTAFAAMLPALTDRRSEIADFTRQRLLEINPSQPDVLRRLTARKISSQYVVPVGGLFILFPLLQLLAVAGLAIALGSFSAGKLAQFPIKLIMSLIGMILLSELLRYSMKRPDGSGLPFTAWNWLFWIAVTVLWASQYFKVTDSQAGFGGPSGIALQTMPTILLLWLLILFSPVLAILLGIAGESPDPIAPPGKMYIGSRPLGFGTYIVVFLIFGTLLGLMALHDLQSKNNRFGKYLTLLNLILGITAMLHHPVLLFRMLR